MNVHWENINYISMDATPALKKRKKPEEYMSERNLKLLIFAR